MQKNSSAAHLSPFLCAETNTSDLPHSESTRSSEQQWGVSAVHCPQVFAQGEEGHKDVLVAVVDTGIAPHKDLRGTVIYEDSVAEAGASSAAAMEAAASGDGGVRARECW
ncbi:peptidase s8 and s53 subtilisin kexin sedolisin [Cyclospora cayetanensis]|uniref:subtilisin n=1 Tax=Cyclospora cayetanensis TaxID=88456 RepID=A0A1D3CS28_9EIME|nr:peptidase s8 and s53 subtilisin kexin sedolisin [Cyclospora cayetanensis]